MASKNQEFLKFSAYSIKDLITRKLSESSKFTDQVYEGSNLAILIDIFSNMAQCMLYSLNNTAAESMFSDTRMYENMNRLVKFIGYNPHGIGTATVNLTLDQAKIFEADPSQKTQTHILYKYSAIDTGKTDSNGKKVYYSTADTKQTNSNDEYQALFYNGLWRLYPTVFTSDGTEYQKLVLENLMSDSNAGKFTADGMVHVYVHEENATVIDQYQTVTEGIFTDNNISNGSYIYKSEDKICNIRLNENKQYELTFGNGFTGKVPPKGASIYIFYLDSNGPDGAIEPYEIRGKQLQHSNTLFGISQSLYDMVFAAGLEVHEEERPGTSVIYSSLAEWSNLNSSSTSVPEEDVDAIRRNAPEWFRTGNRLVTTADYEYYVKNRFRDNIIDVKCQNNWQYISTFFQWLYNLGLNGRLTAISSPTHPKLDSYYINQNKLQKNDLRYADAADGNNVYLWIKMKNDSDLYRDQIDTEIADIKALTQEPVYLKPLDVNFSFCACDVDVATQYVVGNNPFDPDKESWLEITLDDNVLYSSNDIKQQVKSIVVDFFDEKNFTLGQVIDYSDLANRILNLDAVSRIRTIYRNKTSGELRIINGISFATWTTSVIDIGDDMEVSSVSRTLEPFQFPKLYMSSDIQTKIKVIRKSIGNINTIQY